MLAASRPPTQPSRRRAFVALGVGVFAIGWSAIFVRWAGTSGAVSAFYRLLFAALVFVPWRAATARRRAPVPRAARTAAIIAGVFFGADLGFFNSAVMTTSATNATLLGINSPIFVAFGAWWMYRERPTARFWLGFLLALAGVVWIVGPDVIRHSTFGRGDLLAVAGAMCYGAYLLYVQRSRQSMDALTFGAWSAAIGALTLLPFCLATGQQLGGFSERSWLSLVGLALATQIIGHLLIAYAMGLLPATQSSIVLLGQAPMTAILAWPLLGEPIHVGQVIGGALVLGGIIVVNLTRASPAPLPPRAVDDAAAIEPPAMARS